MSVCIYVTLRIVLQLHSPSLSTACDLSSSQRMASFLSIVAMKLPLQTPVSSSCSCAGVSHIPSRGGCSQSLLFLCSPAWVPAESSMAATARFPFRSSKLPTRFPSRRSKLPTGSPILQIVRTQNCSVLDRTMCQAVSFEPESTTSQEVSEMQFMKGKDSQEALNATSSDQNWLINENVDIEGKAVNIPVAIKIEENDQRRPHSQEEVDQNVSGSPLKSFKIWFSDVVVTRKHGPHLFREWTFMDVKSAALLLTSHILVLFAPFTFSWDAFAISFVLWIITGTGVTLSYHRNLSHRSFKVPKWLEYTFAYCGVHAMQGDPLVWASVHRYHHKHCDTENDPHSPTQGIWHSHFGWFLDRKFLSRKVAVCENIPDMIEDPFYTFLRNTYILHPLMLGYLMYQLGGFPYVVWCMGVRVACTYNLTFFLNSVCHIWGERKYKTNDFSRNNWWVSFFFFGEGWHNNHHAFPSSARHGFDWWEIDLTWGIISFLEKIGVATNVKRPRKEDMAKLLLK